MIKGKYLRERKALRVKRRFKLIIILTIILVIYKILSASFSLFVSTASSAADIDVAFYVVKDSYQTKTIDIGSISPEDKTLTYQFSISNFYPADESPTGEEIVSDTDIEYTLKIDTTTNLPLTYKVYIGETKELGTDHAVSDVTQDEDNTYFKTILEDSQEFSKGNPQTYYYTLYIEYPSDDKYLSSDYQSIIDSLQISLNSNQKVTEIVNVP